MILPSRSGGMAIAAAAFGAGVLLSISLKAGAFLLAMAVAVALAAAVAGSLPIALAASGFLAGSLTGSPPPAPPPGTATLQGSVVSMPRRQDDRVRFLLSDSGLGRVEVSAPDLPVPLAPGDAIVATADLRPPPAPRNPGAPDGALSLSAHGVTARAWTRTAPARTAPPSPVSRVAAARVAFGVVASRALPPPEAALLRAIGAGDESLVDAATRERFARSGLAHVLSVSGFHLAVVAIAAFRLLQGTLLRVPALAARVDVRPVAALATLPPTALYAVATGATVPVLRSATGASLLFAAIATGRPARPAAALAVAGLALLALDPGALLDVSFQLSFASVAGLVTLSGPLRRALPFRPDATRRMGRAAEAALQGVAASAAATLATAPLLALHFRSLSTVAVLANLIALPLAAALTVAGAAAYLASAVAPPLAHALLVGSRPVAALFLAVNDAFAAPPFAAVGLASPGWALVAAACALGIGARAARGRLRLTLALGACAALLLPGPVRRAAARLRPGIEVVFLSVGQGDCTLVRLPDGSAVLVDAGGDPSGRYDPGARDVLPFLRDMGVDRLAAVFVSHPHPDHLQGVPSVVAGLGAAPVFASHDRGDEAARAAFARLPPVTELSAGDALTLAGVRFRVLGPPRGDRRLVENDASLVLHVVYGETSFLLPGDVEAAGEAALAAAGIPAVDVVKAPHHGSRTSSGHALVSATRPRHVVFPVGQANRYGFPHGDTVARWRAGGAEIHRTDEGPVRFRSDGARVWRARAEDALDAWALARGR
jgi:competence protein ComEC